jgi:hypothetical protein
LSKPFIHVDKKKYGDYARIFYPSWENNTKKVVTENLGRVIDLEKGLFKNRTRGLFHFDFESGFKTIEPPKHRTEIISNDEAYMFGNIYVAYQILRRDNFLDLLTKIYPGHEDSLVTLILFRLLTDKSYIDAYQWWFGSYAKLLLPNSSVQSKSISEHLVALGQVNLQPFFKEYLKIIYGDQDICGVVIDGAGVPNDINIHLTTINNHNGIFSDQIRLIYVIDHIKKVPIYFRVVAGNIVDVSTLRTIISEIKSLNIDIKYAVLDAGYYSEENVKFLYANKINFVTRMVSNRIIAKELIGANFHEIINMNNHIIHNGRLLFVKKFDINICGHKGYAYIAVDQQKRTDEIEALVYNNTTVSKKTRLSNNKLEIESKLLGTFILISSINLEISEIIPYYSTSNYIEQVFDVSKNNDMLLPIHVHSIHGVMGHILINFLTIISNMKINSYFNSVKYSANNALFGLSLLIGRLRFSELHNCEPNKIMKDYLKILNVPIPRIIDVNTNTCLDNNYFDI